MTNPYGNLQSDKSQRLALEALLDGTSPSMALKQDATIAGDILGTGSVARSVEDKLAESISVRDYADGVDIGNDSNDCHAAVEAAIAAAVTDGRTSIFFPPGIYRKSSVSLITQAGLKFWGIGATIKHLNSSGSLFEPRTDDLTFEDLIFDGNATGGITGDRPQIYWKNGAKRGIIRSCTFLDDSQNCIKSNDIVSLTIEQCKFLEASCSFITSIDKLIIRDNYTDISSKATRNAFTSSSLTSFSKVRLLGNHVVKATRMAFEFPDVVDLVAVNNIIESTDDTSMSFPRAKKAEVCRNVIRASGKYGIEIGGEVECNVSDNTIEGLTSASYAGIQFDGGASTDKMKDISIERNRLRNFAAGAVGIHVLNGTSATFENLDINDNRLKNAGGIYIDTVTPTMASVCRNRVKLDEAGHAKPFRVRGTVLSFEDNQLYIAAGSLGYTTVCEFNTSTRVFIRRNKFYCNSSATYGLTDVGSTGPASVHLEFNYIEGCSMKGMQWTTGSATTIVTNIGNVCVSSATITLPSTVANRVAAASSGAQIPSDVTASSQTVVYGTVGPITRIDAVLAGARTYTLSTTGVSGGEIWTWIRTANSTGAFDASLGSVAALATGESCQLYFDGSAWALYRGVAAMATT